MMVAVHERVQHLVHHAHVIVALVLLLHIHQIFVQGIQPRGQQFGDMKTGLRRRRQKLAGIFNDGE